MASSSSPPHQPPPPPFSDYLDPPLGIPLLLPAQPQPPSSSRRLPPPCWTPDETAALIDAYRDKWYSLRRGNLRAAHWQDVADNIHRLCPHVYPPKTSVQCRHKMEKLRKRYRAELQRAKSIPHHRFSSSWIYFSKMDSMEKGNSSVSPVVVARDFGNGGFNDVDDDEEGDGNDDDINDEDYGVGSFGKEVKNLGRNGLKIRIPGNSNSNSRKNYGVSNPNPRFGFKPSIQSRWNEFGSPPLQSDDGARYSGSYVKNGSNGGGGSSSFGMGLGVMKMIKKKRSALGKKERRRETGDNVVMAMVEAIRVLGEGYVNTEMTKMEMARDSEKARMEIEMKRTQMILEYHQNIVDTFVKGWSDRIVNNGDGAAADDDDDDDKNEEGDSPRR